MKLSDSQEVVGRLSTVQTDGDKHILTFLISHEVEIPVCSISIHTLHSLLGMRIGVLYLGGVYKIRKILD